MTPYEIRRECRHTSGRNGICDYPVCGGCGFSTRRVVITAPLSVITHNVHANAPARSWLAYGETGRATFIANTGYDWRLALVQAVHELIEAALHRHYGVAEPHIDAFDAIAFAQGREAATDAAHDHALAWEFMLARRLGVNIHDYARAVYGMHDTQITLALRQAP